MITEATAMEVKHMDLEPDSLGSDSTSYVASQVPLTWIFDSSSLIGG